MRERNVAENFWREASSFLSDSRLQWPPSCCCSSMQGAIYRGSSDVDYLTNIILNLIRQTALEAQQIPLLQIRTNRIYPYCRRFLKKQQIKARNFGDGFPRYPAHTCKRICTGCLNTATGWNCTLWHSMSAAHVGRIPFKLLFCEFARVSVAARLSGMGSKNVFIGESMLTSKERER